MTRLLQAISIVALSVITARAETDLVVLGPAVPDGTRPALIADVKQAIDRAAVGPRTEGIGPSCAVDPACVKNTGADLGARRAVAVSVVDAKKQIKVSLVMFDVAADEDLGRRELSFTPKKLEKELAAELRKFVDDAPTERSKALFTKGNQHYQLGELAPALAAYKRAYQVKPLPEFLFNIAQCHRKLGQFQDAITMYQSYLVGVPDASNKAIVEDLIAESKAAIAKAEGSAHESERLAAERAEQLRLAREAEARAEQERRKREQVKSKRRVFPWLAIGIGAAAIIGGGLLYATSETDDGSQPTYRDTRPAGIGVAIGGAALTTTGVFWIAVF